MEGPVAPIFAVPPAESPSTRYNSQFAGFLSEQSASLPGREPPSIAFLRMMSSRALRAASLAFCDVRHLSMIRLASCGWSSRNIWTVSATTPSTWFLTSGLPSFVLVWPSNCGSGSFTLTTEVRPSRVSSPARLPSFRRPCLRA